MLHDAKMMPKHIIQFKLIERTYVTTSKEKYKRPERKKTFVYFELPSFLSKVYSYGKVFLSLLSAVLGFAQTGFILLSNSI